mgnify:CR=1 FL=1
MATHTLKQAIDGYFQTNFTTATIHYEGMPMNDLSTVTSLVSLVYEPVTNESYGMDGTSSGRIEYAGLYKVFCYAKSPVKAFILADAVKTFLNGKEIGTVSIGIGQDSGANDLENGFHQVLCYFNVSEWA